MTDNPMFVPFVAILVCAGFAIGGVVQGELWKRHIVEECRESGRVKLNGTVFWCDEASK
jgi:hypothetical protein